ncbi:MAG: hypothetical protein J0I32_04960 [Sphingobacteriales bacterium]|nr:hypothetical protein [Sphingobacteriales bacterium]OJV98509.1 MAG: hypothetical protein BGO52_12055 [Sphingobacteriales bacterium 44-61]
MLRTPILLILCLSFPRPASSQLAAGDLRIQFTDSGYISGLKNIKDGKEYIAPEQPGTLLQLVVKETHLNPYSIKIKGQQLLLSYPGKKQATVKLTQKPSYLKFELTAISDGVDAVLWGPFKTTITDTIGNSVGVVRNATFAIGIQCLNTKTSGGELKNEEGAVYDPGTTATSTTYGSSLQAFSINRLHERIIKVWDKWPAVTVKGIKEGALTGSAIALFGCSNGTVLPTIQQITKDNNLPYAVWQNEWIKTSAASGKPYLITTFNETNIDTFLNYALRMGLAGVYHEDPFETWGHFQLKKDLFPNGREGFKRCVEKAHAKGLRLGFHTLTTFITTNDPYISPVPDKRLAFAGSTGLTESISADASEIKVNADQPFTLNSDLNSVLVDDEIIRFSSVSGSGPFILSGCTRGAFGTQRSAHAAGKTISRLIDHPYNVFFPDWDLQKEIAGNIARFINETGSDQMDFDGHEGTYANGMGDLSFNTFAEEVFRQADHPVVFGSSRANHYFWHINNYLNWGEPWYGTFRESQSDIRMNYQKFHEVNYMPNMLGWFLIKSNTDPEDINWMLARAAGYHAGYALVLREEALTNPHLEEIISLINRWKEAQEQQLFSAAQREWLKNTGNEAELILQGKQYLLRKFHKNVFVHEAKVLQPGEPSRSSWPFEINTAGEVPRIVLQAEGESGSLTGSVIEIDGNFRLELPVPLSAGEALVIERDEAILYNKKGQPEKQLKLGRPLPSLTAGHHTLSFDAGRNIHNELNIQISLRITDTIESLR